MTSRDPVLAVENISLSYGRHPAIEDACFSVNAGEFVHVVGRNGSGKSSLFKGILGLLRPVAGKVRIKGGVANAAYLPQESDAVADFPATVTEVVLSGCQSGSRPFPFYTRDDHNLAFQSLAVMGVADLAGRPIGNLSGGQRRRVFLARCLCREPRLLLLDEPYNGLDPNAADDLGALLRRLTNDLGVATLMTTHDLESAARGTRVIELDRRLLFDGPASEWVRWRRRRISVRGISLKAEGNA